jgi:uncharacterized protein (TIGR00369 family)
VSATTIPDPSSFDRLPPERAAQWARFGSWEQTFFPSFVGLVLEEARLDYARMRLAYRPELDQPAGVVHGGAISTLIDTVVVPAIGAAYDTVPVMLTLNLNVAFLGALVREDAIGHGWVVRRGRSVVFAEAAVVGATSGTVAATGTLTYAIRPPR